MDFKNRFRPFIVIPFLLLSIYGLLILYSVVRDDNIYIFYKQLLWFFMSLLVFWGLQYIPIKLIYISSYILYFSSILLLIFIKLVKNLSVERWLDFGIAYIQPSEFAKIALVLALSRFLISRKDKKDDSITILISISIFLIPFFLVFIQPDLGTSILYLILFLLILFFNETNYVLLFIILTPFLSIIFSFFPLIWIVYIFLIPFILYYSKVNFLTIIKVFFVNIFFGGLTPFVWKSLREYQKIRFLSFISTQKDIHGYGWSILQAKIAIGSGGILGKGYLNGTQKGLNFVPQQHTDFIFSALCEELGLIGYLVLIFLFLIPVLYVLFQVGKIKSKYTKLILSSFSIFIFVEVMLNLMMSTGLIPVVGITLPLFSYGGSSYLTTVIIFGILNRGLIEKYKYW